MREGIIRCAVTGAVHTPTRRPHLPLKPEEIGRQAIDAAQAGAAVLHLHARDPRTGKPTPDPEVFMQFLPQIAEATDAIVNITTGGGQGLPLDGPLPRPPPPPPRPFPLPLGSITLPMTPPLPPLQ